MRLGDLRAYARIPGDWPITAIHFPYQTRRKLNPGFLPRKLDENLLKEVEIVSASAEVPLIPKSNLLLYFLFYLKCSHQENYSCFKIIKLFFFAAFMMLKSVKSSKRIIYIIEIRLTTF